MSHLFKVDRVNYLCTCGVLRPITGVYFCRHCVKLRCGNCASHELDTLFCPQCLENMPSTEARLKKNRCANCFDCPSCSNTLSTRATSIQAPSPDDPNKTVGRKFYYLACTGCRWTSRDVELKDQTIATGGWGEQDNPDFKRIQSLLEFYRATAQREKFEREKKRSSKRKSSYLTLTEKYSLSSSFSSVMGRKSLSPISSYTPKVDSSTLNEIAPAEAEDEVDSLPEDIFTAPLDLTNVTSIQQRLASPESQPSLTSDLYPVHKHILVKRSIRCRYCDHNLFKPEYNPSSIKFKIQLGAFYHVPDIRIVKQHELKCGTETTIQLSLCNPTPHDMTVALLPFVPEAHIVMQKGIEGDSIDHTCGTPSSSLIRVVDIPSVTTDFELSADVALPQGQLVLAARDDTAEYDDHDTATNYRDDPQVVAWRRVNKVGVNLQVTPHSDAEDAKIGFILRYDYTNTVAPAAESRTSTLNIPVVVNAGPITQ